jgi:hypothetical protein
LIALKPDAGELAVREWATRPDPARHAAAATRASAAGDAFAEAFHLDRLLALAPTATACRRRAELALKCGEFAVAPWHFLAAGLAR